MLCVRCGRKRVRSELCYYCRKELGVDKVMTRKELQEYLEDGYAIVGTDYDCSCNACAAYRGGYSSVKPCHPNQKPRIYYLAKGYDEISAYVLD